MKIFADKYLYALDKLIPGDFELNRYDPEDGFPDHATQYDALLIRTVTKLNSDTLPEAGNLKFVGSATAGFDHVDIDHLHTLGIEFARSEGCNANAVAEYVLTVLYRWGQLRGEKVEDLRIGVVGCGNTGGALIGYLKKLGIEYVPYDPPKEEREENFTSADLDELLSCDVLSFHTPLTKNGPHPTYHMCDGAWLKHGFKLIINASRGGVVDEKALFEAKRMGLIRDFILDVWENEPVFSDQIAKEALIATPHIAGYSREAKWKASEIVIRKMIEFFGDQFTSPNQDEKPKRSNLAEPEDLSFADFLWKNHKIDFYDQELRKLTGLTEEEKGQKFADLRSNTPTRFEFRTIIGQYLNPEKLPEEVMIF
ncbi:MAG: 4-phosphoerythronate dehydrogenase [Balneolaceae bacterium]|nr:4-phosphoerythronate dehydrogenase [Balneolaceae bacterium]